MNTYILIKNRPCVPSILYPCAITYFPNCKNWKPIHTYVSHMLVKFTIQRHFYTSLPVRVSNSGRPVSCDRNVFTKINCHNIHNHANDNLTLHHKLLHTGMIHHTKKFLRRTFSYAIKYHRKWNYYNIHNYTTTHTHIKNHRTILHKLFFHTNIHQLKNRFHQVGSLLPWMDNNQGDSDKNSKFIWPRKCWTCYLFTTGIYYLYYSIVILKIILNILF